MFESALLPGARRNPWSLGGLLLQSGVVAAMVAVPLLSPEVISVILPKATIQIPVKLPPPVEVEAMRQAARTSALASPATVVHRPARVFVAPTLRAMSAPPSADAVEMPFVTLATGPATGFPTGVAHSLSYVPGVPPPPPPEPKRDPPTKQVRVGGDVKPPQVLSRVNPIYPPLARQARISGVVKLEGILSTNGAVTRLRVISGHPLLVNAAVEAVSQWRYTPTLLNGQPVEVIAPIDVNFILSQ